ncbi:MAG: decaprenyl-phosphate phosphoribosyltransferase [Planctomycetia bacterium]|jgi:4-hydroxybenzoate polyprenyltransferase|nr:decaprenyl-phosphate phosphoribosyltransferase [Planctomycetia bacterium]MCC7314773.1 decaprenyl-phosphate phosphoribosyltransferase [Planctomycetota bacterium]
MVRTLSAVILLLRPAQWIKNIFLFAALVFGARRGEPEAILLCGTAFVIFCLLSGAVYAFNDMRDYREDALHPTKKRRPVASGAISPAMAGGIAVLLAIVALAWSLRLPGGFAITALSFLILNLVYTLWGKYQVLLDVILIAMGFVMRALAGAQAIDVEVSAWLIICTFTLCLFLGFGKRRCELAVLETSEKAAAHRATLARYNPGLLTQLLATSGGIAVITFLLYTLDPSTSFHSLVFTTPIVFYAIFRYATVIELGERTGPTDVLVNDRPFLITAIAWTIITMALVIYGEQIEKYLPRLRYPGQTHGQVMSDK